MSIPMLIRGAALLLARMLALKIQMAAQKENMLLVRLSSKAITFRLTQAMKPAASPSAATALPVQAA